MRSLPRALRFSLACLILGVVFYVLYILVGMFFSRALAFSPRPWRLAVFCAFDMSWGYLYASVLILACGIFAHRARRVGVRAQKADVLPGVWEVARVPVCSLLVFFLLTCFRCWRWYGGKLLVLMLVGALPASAPEITYAVFSLGHLGLLTAIILCAVRWLQKSRRRHLLWRCLAVVLAGYCVAVAVCVGELVLLRETPVGLIQGSALALAIFLVFGRARYLRVRRSEST